MNKIRFTGRAVLTLSCLVFIQAINAQKYECELTNVKFNIESHSRFRNNENIEKAYIFSKAIDLYVSKNYSIDHKISITYNLNPNTFDFKTRYFLSFEKGKVLVILGCVYPIRKSRYKELKKKGLIIRVIASDLSLNELISLVDYGLTNSKLVEKSQKKSYNYLDPVRIKSIEPDFIEEVLKSVKNDSALSVSIPEPIYCCAEGKQEDWKLNYYLKKVKYHFYFRGNADSVLFSRKDIKLFDKLSDNEYVVFDNDSSFYYVNALDREYHSNTLTSFYKTMVSEGRYVPIKCELTKDQNISFKRYRLFQDDVYTYQWIYNISDNNIKYKGVERKNIYDK